MPKRFAALLVTLPILVGLIGVPEAVAQVGVGPCSFTRDVGETTVHFEKRLIRCAVETFGPVPGGAARAICIAKRESGLDPKAQSPTGMYLGLYQHAATYWPTRFKTWIDTSWDMSDSALNGRSNSVVTIRMVRAAATWKRAGWPPAGC